MQKEITIRDIKPDDLNALIELYDNVWPETAGTYEGKTKWMLFFKNPFNFKKQCTSSISKS